MYKISLDKRTDKCYNFYTKINAERITMIYEEKVLGVGNAKLTIYKPDHLNEKKEAILVIPGGGYGGCSSFLEGEPIALAYVARGFAVFVLEYSVGIKIRESKPITEASAALAYIRKNSEHYEIDPQKIYAVGFSAGGHLCGTLATLWHKEEICRESGVTAGENRPNAVALCYPVISSGKYAHTQSFKNLLCTDEPTKEDLEYYSIEKNVDERSVPAFIIHTAEDRAVPVQNSIVLANAYADAGVQFELHIYPHGDHAFALGNDVTNFWQKENCDEKYARWVDDSIYFFRNLK